MTLTPAVSRLRAQDRKTLEATGLSFELNSEAGMTDLVVKDFPVPPGLSSGHVDVLLRLPLGFPDATPDMFWVSPALTTAAGGQLPGTEVMEAHVGRTWQRWSRHIAQQWRPGIDNLETYLAYVRRCLRHAVDS